MLASPFWFDIIMCITLFFTMFVALPPTKIPNVHPIFIIFVACVAILQLGLAPATEIVGTDRPAYAYMFTHADQLYNWGFRDVGFTYYLKLCDSLIGTAKGGFLISATIYVIAHIYFYSKSFNHYILYVLLLSFLSLGFSNHHYNVLRAGLSISLLLIAFSKNQKRTWRVIFSLLAISFHISSLLVVVGYIVTEFLKNTKLLYCIWGIMFIALLAGLFDSFQEYLGLFSYIDDNRIDVYLSGNDYDYKVGLRLDFITYSVFPIIVGAYYVYKRKYIDKYYIHIYNLYLLINACWLIFSKMPHNDRMAYLSWCFIPFILLYPIFNDTKNIIAHKKLLLTGLTMIIVGINMYLKYLR